MIRFVGLGCVTEDVHRSNVAHAWSLNPKRITKWGNGPLAVCGSGPSLKRNLDRLKTYSEVWGINQTAVFLNTLGIPAAMYSVDPQYQPTVGIERAVLASCTHPQVLSEAPDVTVFPMSLDEGEGWAALAGTSSACRVPLVALKAGFTRVDYYGCEGSFDFTTEGGIHVDIDGRTDADATLLVRANGQLFATIPGLMMQSEHLAEIVRTGFARDESGGLLGALVADPAWRAVALSPGLATTLYGDAPLADFTI